MTRCVAPLLIVAFAAPGLLLGAEPDVSRPRVAVLRPANVAANEWWQQTSAAGDQVQDLLIAALATTQQYQVLGRAFLADTLAEKKIWLAGELSPGGAAKLGRQLGVRYVVATTLKEYGTSSRGVLGRRKRKLLGFGGFKGFRVAVSVNVFDGESGVSVWSDGRDAEVSRTRPADAPAEEAAVDAARIFEETLVPLMQELADALATATLAEPESAVEAPS